MKTKIVLLSAAFLAMTGASFAAPPADQAKKNVLVQFDQPEKFTDVRHTSFKSDKPEQAYLDTLKEHLEQRAPRYLADDQTLSITFTDIDMAGDFEPWRGSDYDHVRVVKDIYPPRLNFTYKVTDASGAVVKEGSEKLIELGFQIHGSPVNSQDNLRYEKAMLDNWLRDRLGPAKKAKK